VTASLIPGLAPDWTTPFWAMDSAGTWAYREHTAAQIQQVGQDGKAQIAAALLLNSELEAQVNAAMDAATVNAIHW
jgi:hypothetical protein